MPTGRTPLSIVTNICPIDELRILHTLPHWLKAFNDEAIEVLVIADPAPPRSRFLAQHGNVMLSPEAFESLQQTILQIDPRVRVVPFENKEARRTESRRWFKYITPMRAQNGFPVFPYLYGIGLAKADTVLKVDCDMAFCNRGWVQEGAKLLKSGAFDLVEPARGFLPPNPTPLVSSRAMLLNRPRFFAKCLPLFPHTLDPLRSLHRLLSGRAPWITPEEMFDQERIAGRLKFRLLDSALGFSFHIGRKVNFENPEMAAILERLRNGGDESLVRQGSGE